MQRLRFKEYLFYDEFCYIKFKNKEFGLLEDLKRYLYKHPFNVNHYEIQIVNTNVRNLYSEKDFFDRLYNLDIENGRKFLDKFSPIRQIFISKSLDEIYGEITEVYNFSESFDFGYLSGEYEELNQGNLVRINASFANSLYDWSNCSDVNSVINFGLINHNQSNSSMLFQKAHKQCVMSTLEYSNGNYEPVWYNDLKFYPRACMEKVTDPDIIKTYKTLIASYFKEEGD